MKKTHCKRGHEFTPENTNVLALGRECRACKKMHRQNRQLKWTTYERDRCREQKAILVAEHGGKCQDCGGIFPDCCYQFHHRNPDDKDFNVGCQMLRNLDILRTEADKCDLICANCHVIRTYGDERISKKIRASIALRKETNGN